MAADLGAALGRIHQIDAAGIPPTPARWEDETWTADIEELPAVAHLVEAVLPPALLHAARPYLAGEVPAPNQRRARRLAHNDLCADHVLVDPATGRLAGIIDFADAMVGDPVLDFVGLLTVGDRPFVAQVLRHYPLPAADDFQVTFDWLARVLTLRWLADAVVDNPGRVEAQRGSVERAFDRAAITATDDAFPMGDHRHGGGTQ